MDMMHSLCFVVAPVAPSSLTASQSPSNVTLNWVDNSISETGFIIQRAENANFTANLTNITVGENVVVYVDTTAAPGTTYYYRVQAINVVGDTFDYTDPNLNEGASFPTKIASSAWSNSAASSVTPDKIGVLRNGNWYLDLNGNRVWDAGDVVSNFGITGDQPAVGDW